MKWSHIWALLLIPALSQLLPGSPCMAQKRCEECARRAILEEFTNPNNPDYEQKREEWRQCMQALLGNYVSFDANDPVVVDAAGQCEQFAPTDHAYCFPAIVAAFLGENLTNPCFHMLSLQYFNPDMHRNPEYSFRGSYEGNLEGGRIVEAVTNVFKPVIERMSMQLWYNGTTPELVHEWSSEGTVPSPRGLLHKLDLPKYISPLLDEFEKRPVKCDVKIPLPEELCKNGTGEIILSNFTDSRGNSSKPFNRILVSIFKGEILNGENSVFGTDYRVFTLENGEVKVQYRPPADKDDGYDWLRVYNSCEILPAVKAPMADTPIDELIVNQYFPISCGFYEGTISVTMRWDYNEDNGKSSTRYVGSQSVTYNGIFKPIPMMEGMEGQPVKIFGKGTATGTWQFEEKRYCDGDCSCPGLVYEEHGAGSVDPLSMDGLTIMTNVWPTDDPVVAAQMGQFGMVNWYDIFTPGSVGVTISRIRSKNADGSCEWDDRKTETNIIESQVRYKLESVEKLSGNVIWSSSTGTTAVSITDLNEAIYEQKPFDPEQDGHNYTYTITWNLRAI